MDQKSRRAAIAIVATVFFTVGVIGLHTPPASCSTFSTQTSDGVTICYQLYQPRPTKPDSSGLYPVVFIGHGIMVNKEMMTNFALELASQGYIVANVDWRGHGQSTGELTREGLIRDLEAVLSDVSVRSSADMSKIALLGYSMGGFPTFQYAVETPAVRAWVGVGTAPDETLCSLETPKNVLILIARHDEAFSPEEARLPMSALTGIPPEDIEFGNVYGNLRDGTARSLDVVEMADHLTTPWNSDFVFTATSWISQAFGDPYEPTSLFHQRVLYLVLGITGFLGLLVSFCYILAHCLYLKPVPAVSLPMSLPRFIAFYYIITLFLFPTIVLFAPLILTPLPFTAMLTMLTGGLGVNLLFYSWVLYRRQHRSLLDTIRENLSRGLNIWIFSGAVTFLFLVGYCLLIGSQFLGMVPSHPRIPYAGLYTVILFWVFLFYSLFIQKCSLPVLSRVKIENRHFKLAFTALSNFLLIYSWFFTVIMTICVILGNYFFAMVLILMVPIFLVLTSFSVFMEKLTGSAVPNAVLQAAWLGLVITTLSPFGGSILL
ncbi:MAG: alpha/beta fold hydrolase [Theionarchaea archaeon]|nr:alpha/beta fold hydrolase [Theionarchaea archaeon]MBU7036767.1 alpha/beta fold hydrolase [Theionarchaea archaeon]